MGCPRGVIKRNDNRDIGKDRNVTVEKEKIGSKRELGRPDASNFKREGE